MEKRKTGSVLHINLITVYFTIWYASNQTHCALIGARLHGAAHAAVGCSARSILFQQFCKQLWTQRVIRIYRKVPSLTAGLHLVLNTSCLRKKKCLVRHCMVECFHAIAIGRKHLHMGSTVLFFLQKTYRFLETLSSFCIFEKALFLDPRDLILESRDLILGRFEHRGSRIESQVSSLESQGSRNKAFSNMQKLERVSRKWFISWRKNNTVLLTPKVQTFRVDRFAWKHSTVR